MRPHQFAKFDLQRIFRHSPPATHSLRLAFRRERKWPQTAIPAPFFSMPLRARAQVLPAPRRHRVALSPQVASPSSSSSHSISHLAFRRSSPRQLSLSALRARLGTHRRDLFSSVLRSYAVVRATSPRIRASPMPTKTICPRCQRIGLVRYEYVIRGRHTSLDYYCGGCDYEWSVATSPEDSSPAEPAPRRKPRTRILRAHPRP